MRGTLIAFALLAGCTQSSSTSLQELTKSYGETQLEVVALGQINVLLHVAPTSGCPTLSEEVNATFDGVHMSISGGGYDVDSKGCYPIAFWTPEPFPSSTAAGFERATNTSEIVILDKTAEWRVGTGRLFTNDFVIDRINGTIEWQNVASMTSAQIGPAAAVTIDHNIIHYPKDIQVQWVSAYAHPVPTLCDGPALCTVDLQGSRDYVAQP